MIFDIFSHLLIAVVAVFVYRKNAKVIDPYLAKVDQLWDKLGLTNRFKKLFGKKK